MKAIKNLNEGNASMFMKALRINGTHAITLQNANRVGPITLSNVQLRIYQAGKLIQKDVEIHIK
jgi:hypothetical protein